MLNHSITTSDVDSRWVGPGAGDFIDRYVFPDGGLPHLSVVIREMAAAGLEVADVESLRRHYARTCHEWANRLDCNLGRAAALAGEKRLRIWQIYLAGCAYGFANGRMNFYQVLWQQRRKLGGRSAWAHPRIHVRLMRRAAPGFKAGGGKVAIHPPSSEAQADPSPGGP